MDDRTTIADLQARLLEAEARLHSQAQLEAGLRTELDTLWRVCRLHARVADESDLQARLEQTVEAANSILGTDRGCIQLLSPDGQRLEMCAHRGFGPGSRFIQHFLRQGSKIGCDTVRERGERLIIEDVATFPGLQGTVDREVGLQEDIHATQSTPMVTRSGDRIGVLSNQFRAPHRPSEAQLRLIDLLAWNAAEIVERHHTEAALQASERRLQRVLETDSVAVLFFNQQGVLIDANDAFLDMTGYGRDEVAGGQLSWQQMTPPEWLAASQAQMDRFWIEGRIGPYEKEYFRKDGVRAWMLFSGRDLGDGTIVELGVDITARKHAEAVLRESEARLAAAFESVPVGAAVIDTTGRAVVSNAEYRRFLPAGIIPSRDPQQVVRWHGWDAAGQPLTPDDFPAARALRGEQVVPGQQMVFTDTSGRNIWTTVASIPIRDERQQVTGAATAISDINAAKLSAQALAAAELRQRTLMEGIPQLVWRSGANGDWTWASPQWLAFTGQTQAQSHGLGWLAAVHPDDQAATQLAWSAAERNGVLDVEHRIRRAADHAWLWHHTRSVPVRDAGGGILEWLGTSTDVQDLRALQEQQAVLVAELQHRTRNLLGVVRSMAEKTARNSTDLLDFRTRFRTRLEALSRVQGHLARVGERGRVTFDEVLDSELAALHGAAERISLEGPRGVHLRSSTVQTIALALHELATNAVKYGALGQPTARLAVRWSVQPGEGDRPWLHVDWRESGVTMQPSTKPVGGGQGRELIERALPYQLNAKTTYALQPDGVHCTLSIPVSTSLAPDRPSHGG